ncbi:MAG: T9SS type A sorting domain-containing protein [Bacteroidales bacterium]|nr:T9SS type A sorting domain-containing protein [Bacteroidales bacterium]
MKKLLFLLLIGISFNSIGQKATKVVAKNNCAKMSVRYTAPISDQSILNSPVLSSNPTTGNYAVGPEIVIGKTKYDLQSNRSMGRRLFVLSNGNIVATWTFANSGIPWNDRGTGYNYNDGSGNWSPYPIGTPISNMTRIESSKVGWPNYGATNNDGSEIVVAHDGTNLVLKMMQRTTLGSGNWSQLSNNFPMEWSRVAIGDLNENTVHVIGTMTPTTSKKSGVLTPLLYVRSTNGGTNWTNADVIPGYDSTIIKKPISEDYAIDAEGNTVAIVEGGWYNSVYLFKSTDNGTNWSKTLIWKFPYAPFNPDSTAVPATDTIPCFDGAFSVLVDNSGKVHVWGGVTRFNQSAVGSANIYYFPQQCGLIYWNDDMPTITGDLKTSGKFCWPYDHYVERNGNGIWDCIHHLGWINLGFGVGGTSMPSGSIDACGNLYVVFQHMSDADPSIFHIYGTDTVPYRHLFCITSTDNGATWSDAIEITPFDEGRDYVFPSVAKNTTDSLRLIYQEDDLPGHSLNPSSGNPHPSGYECDIVYLSVPFTNLHPAYYTNKVKGIVFNDLNNNLIKDANEKGFPGIILKNDKNLYGYKLSITDTSGNYRIFSDTGDYKITIPNPIKYATITPLEYTGHFADKNLTDSAKNFAVHFIADMNDLEIYLTPLTNIVRAGRDADYQLKYKNAGSEIISGSVELNYSDSLEYKSSSITPDNITNTKLTWNFSNLNPLEEKYISIKYTLSTKLKINDALLFTAKVNPIAQDVTPENNVDTLLQIVRGSFDPNEKVVNPIGNIPVEKVISGQEMIYTIHFQNTGNDTAFVVRILDTLSQKLNIPLIEMVSSSHPCTWKFKSDNVVEWTFDNILLPDSNVNEPLSHGFVKYKVPLLTTLADNDEVKNTAYIYFDYNAPVKTNTVINKISDKSINIKENKPAETSGFKVYPNPYTNQTQIIYSLNKKSDVKLEVFDIIGKKIAEICSEEQNAGEYRYLFSAKNFGLTGGIYIVKLRVNGKIEFKKIVEF